MQERDRCNEALAKLSPFFHRENYNILVHYQHWLSRFARKALEQQIKQLMAYVQKKAKSITLDQIPTAQKECERLVDQLETRNQIWHAYLFLELASLRLIIAQFAMRSATSIEQVVSSSFEDKPLFDRLYAELYHVIYQYEENHMPLSTPLQITIQDLKNILNHTVSDRDAEKLSNEITNYRTKKMNNECGFLEHVGLIESLGKKLDAILHQEKYAKNLIDADKRATMKEIVESLTDTQQRSTKTMASNETDPLSNIHEMTAPFVEMGKHILNRENSDLKNNIAKLAFYKSRPIYFTHQTFAYLYGFLSYLMSLSSKTDLEKNLLMFQQIITALEEVTQGTSCNINVILNSLKMLTTIDKIESTQWKFFLAFHVGSHYHALHITYGTKNDREPEKSLTSASLSPSNPQLLENFSFSHSS